MNAATKTASTKTLVIRNGTLIDASGKWVMPGLIDAHQLADITVWNKDPIADIAILQDNKNLSVVVKDGKLVDRYPRDEMLVFQQAAE